MAKRSYKQDLFWFRFNILVVFFIVVIVLALFFRFLLLEDQFVDIEMVGSAGEWWYSERQTPGWLTDSLMVGAVEITPTGKKVAQIIDIQSYEEGPNIIFLARVRLLVSKTPRNNTYRFKQQPLSIGSVITLAPGNTKLIGNVTNIFEQNSPDQTKFVNVVVKLYDRYPWFADHIKVGDRYLDPITGEPRMEVTKKTVLPAEAVGFTSTGSLTSTHNAQKRDILLTLKIQANHRGNTYFFANYQPIKIGNELYLPMSDYNLYNAKVVSLSPALP